MCSLIKYEFSQRKATTEWLAILFMFLLGMLTDWLLTAICWTCCLHRQHVNHFRFSVYCKYQHTEHKNCIFSSHSVLSVFRSTLATNIHYFSVKSYSTDLCKGSTKVLCEIRNETLNKMEINFKLLRNKQ
jgi:hypothetical protein